MHRIRLRLKNGAYIETGPRPGATPKLGSPIELSYQGTLYRARVTNVVSMRRQPPRLEAVELVHAEEL
jgi:hypothetical protein